MSTTYSDYSNVVEVVYAGASPDFTVELTDALKVSAAALPIPVVTATVSKTVVVDTFEATVLTSSLLIPAVTISKAVSVPSGGVTLGRASSGLLLRDDFSTDTEANYAGDTGSFAVSGGHMVCTSTSTDKHLRSVGISTAKVMTARVKATSWDGNCVTPVVVGGSGAYNGFMPCGYIVQASNSTTAYVARYPNSGSGATTIDSATISDLADNTYYLWRVYINAAGTHVYVNHGATVLANILDAADTEFTAGQIGINAYDGITSWDWVEARTSHLVTVNNLPSGSRVWVTDGDAYADANESGGTAVVDAGLVNFPLSSILVYDSGDNVLVEIDSSTYSDMGGGDVFAYLQGASANASLLSPTVTATTSKTVVVDTFNATATADFVTGESTVTRSATVVVDTFNATIISSVLLPPSVNIDVTIPLGSETPGNITFVDCHGAISTTGDVTVTAPDGIQDGDILIASFFWNGTQTNPTFPAGFTNLHGNHAICSLEMAWKRASSESGDYVFAMATPTYHMAQVLVLRGCIAAGTPTDGYSNTAYTTSNATVRAAGFTPTAVLDALVWCGFTFAEAVTLASPDGFTDGDQQQCANYYAQRISYKLGVPNTATGDVDGTGSASSTRKHGLMVALKPALVTTAIPSATASAIAPTVIATTAKTVVVDTFNATATAGFVLGESVATRSITTLVDTLNSTAEVIAPDVYGTANVSSDLLATTTEALLIPPSITSTISNTVVIPEVMIAYAGFVDAFVTVVIMPPTQLATAQLPIPVVSGTTVKTVASLVMEASVGLQDGILVWVSDGAEPQLLEASADFIIPSVVIWNIEDAPIYLASSSLIAPSISTTVVKTITVDTFNATTTAILVNPAVIAEAARAVSVDTFNATATASLPIPAVTAITSISSTVLVPSPATASLAELITATVTVSSTATGDTLFAAEAIVIVPAIIALITASVTNVVDTFNAIASASLQTPTVEAATGAIPCTVPVDTFNAVATAELVIPSVTATVVKTVVVPEVMVAYAGFVDAFVAVIIMPPSFGATTELLIPRIETHTAKTVVVPILALATATMPSEVDYHVTDGSEAQPFVASSEFIVPAVIVWDYEEAPLYTATAEFVSPSIHCEHSVLVGVMAAAATAVVPLVSHSSQISAPSMLATALMGEGQFLTGTYVASAILEAEAELLKPTVTANRTITLVAEPQVAIATLVIPRLYIIDTEDVLVSTATAQLLAPSIHADNRVFSDVATATAEFITSGQLSEKKVTAEVLTATVAFVKPLISSCVTVFASVLEAEASLLIPEVTVVEISESIVATATASLIEPRIVTTRACVVIAEPMLASALFEEASTGASNIVSSPVLIATAQFIFSSVSGEVNLTVVVPETLSAQASLPTPRLIGIEVTESGVAQAAAEFLAPIIVCEKTVLSPPATATAVFITSYTELVWGYTVVVENPLPATVVLPVPSIGLVDTEIANPGNANATFISPSVFVEKEEVLETNPFLAAAQLLVPTVSAEGHLDTGVAIATASLVAPVIQNETILHPDVFRAQAQLVSPQVSSEFVALAPVLSAWANLITPSIGVLDTEEVQPSTATACMLSPSILTLSESIITAEPFLAAADFLNPRTFVYDTAEVQPYAVDAAMIAPSIVSNSTLYTSECRATVEMLIGVPRSEYLVSVDTLLGEALVELIAPTSVMAGGTVSIAALLRAIRKHGDRD